MPGYVQRQSFYLEFIVRKAVSWALVLSPPKALMPGQSTQAIQQSP